MISYPVLRYSAIISVLVTLVSLLRLGICGKIAVIKDFIRGWPVIDGDGYRLNVGIVICNKIVATSRHWLRYKLPKRLVRWDSKPVCIGQKQKWFLLRLDCEESKINMQRGNSPEFDGWRWVSYWYPVRQVVSFKRDVYRRAMKEFASMAMPFKERRAKGKRKPRRG